MPIVLWGTVRLCAAGQLRPRVIVSALNIRRRRHTRPMHGTRVKERQIEGKCGEPDGRNDDQRSLPSAADPEDHAEMIAAAAGRSRIKTFDWTARCRRN